MKTASNFVLFLILLTIPGISFAQPQDEPDVQKSFFIDRGIKAVPRRDSTDNNPLEFASHVNMVLGDITRGVAMNQEELDWQDLETYPKAKRKIDPVERKNQVNQYQPLAGHLNLLGAKAMQKAYDKALEGPVAEWNITLTQTEPAIAAGVHNALVQTANTLNARYLSEMVFYDQLDNAQPWARTKVLNTYNTCIHKQINDNQKIWYEALQICSGDSADDSAIQPQYDQAPLNKNDMWQVKQHHRHQVDGDAVQAGQDVVSVVDELFAELIRAGTSPEATQARDSWLELFGDIEFKADSDSRVENKGALSSTELVFKRVMPKKRPGVILGAMIKDRYKTILTEMKAFCNWKDGLTAHDTVSKSTYEQEQNEYWQKIANDEKMRLMSTEGYIWNPAVANMFLEMATDVYSADGNTLNKTCQAYDNEFKNYLQIDSKSKAHDIASTYWTYAKFISYGQLLSSYKQAIQFVVERSSEPGTTDHMIKINALGMIGEVARHDNIPELQLHNRDRLREFLKFVYMDKAQGSGKTSPFIGAPVKAGAGGQTRSATPGG